MSFKKILIVLFLVLAGTSGYLYYEYHKFMQVPHNRIDLKEEYAVMPSDKRHHYLKLPVDHNDQNAGHYKGFYSFSPNFKKNDNIIFFLTDGQMELVSPGDDFTFFEKELKGLSYVLIGRRGHSPTLFPEVYRKDGSLNHGKAMNLYSSLQHIEDINQVRLDMVKNGYLSPEQKIMLFGASGAGFLVQQYLSEYGEHVSKAIILVSGAPDLAIKAGLPNNHNFSDYNPEGAKLFESLRMEKKCKTAEVGWMLFQIGRSYQEPKKEQIKVLNYLMSSQYLKLLKYWLNPKFSLNFIACLFRSPNSSCVKVRWYELVRHDLKAYVKQNSNKINLLLEASKVILADFLKADLDEKLKPSSFQIDRSTFKGEVLVISGNKDVVFSSGIGRLIASSYPNSRFALFADGHRMHFNRKYHIELRKAFYSGGFESEKFNRLFNDKIQLNR
ncbi:hypothetical protein ACFL35_00470 [Candidatus Riflebacteria bacterium]